MPRRRNAAVALIAAAVASCSRAPRCPDDTQPVRGAAYHACEDAYGREHGPRTAFWPDGGRRSVITMRAGSPHGPFRMWHANGRLAISGRYEDGRMAGHWKRFHRSGRLAAEGAMVRGHKQGVWTFWRDGAARPQRVRFDAGRRVTSPADSGVERRASPE